MLVTSFLKCSVRAPQLRLLIGVGRPAPPPRAGYFRWDSVISRQSKAHEENITRVFGDKSDERKRKAREEAEYFAKLKAETEATLNSAGTDKNERQDVLSTEDCLIK